MFWRILVNIPLFLNLTQNISKTRSIYPSIWEWFIKVNIVHLLLDFPVKLPNTGQRNRFEYIIMSCSYQDGKVPQLFYLI